MTRLGIHKKMDKNSMIDIVGSETDPLDGMKMNVEEPIVVLGIEDKARQLKEYVEVGDEEDPEEEVNIEEHNEEDPEEEVRNDENRNEELIMEETNEDDPEEEVSNDENPKEEVSIEENNEDPEEKVSNDENPKEEVSIEEDPEEEVKNDENPKEELIIEDNYKDGPKEEVKNEEDATNDVRTEGKLEAISKNKVSNLRKKPKMLKKKNIGLRKKVKNAIVSTSKLDEDQWVGKVDTEMISLPMLDKNNTPNDVGAVVVTSEQTDIDVDNGVLNMNAVVLGDEEKKEHEIGELSNEENTKEELQNEGDTRNVAKAKEKLEANSKRKANKKIGKKKKKYLRGKNEVVVNNGENPESSKKKTTMKDKCMGVIFMCNSKTKKDCYHYQVLGLPASKRDIVFEIYEGMKLFLYAFDLKLLYGIYEAAGPGGYNIEPKAFNSAFPSQVRFAVSEDCLPLAEEKFKKIIKDNYYSKNKFDCQLNSKQVENLCELFRVASKGSTSKQLNGSQNAEAPPFVDHRPKRPPRGRKAKGPQAEVPAFVERESKQPRRHRKAESQRAEAPRPVDHEPKDHEPKQPRRNKKRKFPRAEAPTVLDRKPKRPRRSRKAEARPFVDPKPKRLRRSQREETQNFLYGDSRHPRWEDERHRTLARDYLYPEDPVAYRREVYEPPLEHPPPRQPLHLPLASSLLPSSERDVYRRDELHYLSVQPLDVDLRRQDEFDYHDSYINPPHQDDIGHHGSYLASRGHSSYRYLSSSVAQPSEYYRPASGRPASAYHLSAAPPPEYQPYRPGYRYYA